MKWRKLGLVFGPRDNAPWMRTHAANPVAEHLQGDVFRVYFGCRDERNVSSISYVEVEIGDSVKVVHVANAPVIGPGPLGAFDDSGTSMACLLPMGSQQFLYYLGWNLGVTVPWRNSIGLAVRRSPDEPFQKYSRAPIVDRNETDPYSISYPWVLKDGDCFKMWYGSNLSWGHEQADMAHVLKYAESADGIHWQREGRIAIDLEPPEEYAVCRPCVLKEGDLYRMWYCHRGCAYRIGYAESGDGIRWERLPGRAGIDVSPSGWDSEMIAYPFVFLHGGRKYMLYNGNRYGREGFGAAVEE